MRAFIKNIAPFNRLSNISTVFRLDTQEKSKHNQVSKVKLQTKIHFQSFLNNAYRQLAVLFWTHQPMKYRLLEKPTSGKITNNAVWKKTVFANIPSKSELIKLVN